MNAGFALVARERLELSRSPTSELAAAALDAQRAAGLERADFIVVAVRPGEVVDAGDVVRRALQVP